MTILAQDREGRLIRTYTATAKSERKLATSQPDQLGPLFSKAFTAAMVEVSAEIAGENDLLMRALAVTPKGVELIDRSKRITILSPRSRIVSESSLSIRGQVTGVREDEPVEMIWHASQGGGGPVRLSEGEAPSVREFALAPPVGKPGQLVTITLTLRSRPGQGKPVEKLAQAQLQYIVRNKTSRPVRQRWAVIVGISEFAKAASQLRPLRFAHTDAIRLRDFLLSDRGGQFPEANVLCLTNQEATSTRIRAALYEFLAKAHRDDLVLIYFSGHGLTAPGSRADNHFLVCHDTDLTRNHLASTSFPMWDVETALNRFIKAERVVVLADACYSGALTHTGGLQPKGAEDNLLVEYLQKLAVTKPGRFILTASRATEKSYECQEHLSGLFSHYLLQGLQGAADRDTNGFVSAGEISTYVRANVSGYASKKGCSQTPQSAGQYDAHLPLSFTASAKAKAR